MRGRLNLLKRLRRLPGRHPLGEEQGAPPPWADSFRRGLHPFPAHAGLLQDLPGQHAGLQKPRRHAEGPEGRRLHGHRALHRPRIRFAQEHGEIHPRRPGDADEREGRPEIHHGQDTRVRLLRLLPRRHVRRHGDGACLLPVRHGLRGRIGQRAHEEGRQAEA